MLRALATATVAAAAMLAITVSPAVAQSKCDSAKLKATGKKCDAKSKCVAKGAAKGAAVDSACTGKAEAKFASAFGKAEGKGNCSTTGDAAAIEAKVDAHVLDVRGELWTDDPAENDCASRKIKGAGKKCSCKLKCESKAANKGVPVDPACLQKCELKFSSAFLKAEGKGGCTTTGDAAAIEAKVDAFVADAEAEIQPPPTTTTVVTTTTTTTTTTTVPLACGNSIIEGSEECDDGGTSPGDGCDSTCQLESANPAVCAGVPTVSGTALDTVLVASGLEGPIHVAAPRLDPSRLFIVEQQGRIRLVKNGTLLPTPFLAIEGIVRCCGEEGLLSVAFHPDYESNRRFFVYYVDNSSNLVIARYEATLGNPDDADESSAHIVLTIPHPGQGNHNGGNLNFGPDGFLYAATGDGGGSGDPNENAQENSSRLGKLLRIDPETDAVTNHAKGLRNPFRWSFDRANGDIYIGDVGQGRWEEISYAAANPSGVNYGWDDMEGRHCFEPGVGCLTADRTLPVLEYCNTNCPAVTCAPAACSTFQAEKGQAVTGGFVYRGCAMPDLQGRYFYADYYSGFIRSFMGVSGGDAQSLQNHTADLDPPGSLAIGNPVSFGEDTRGELYIADHAFGVAGQGEVYRIVPGS